MGQKKYFTICLHIAFLQMALWATEKNNNNFQIQTERSLVERRLDEGRYLKGKTADAGNANLPVDHAVLEMPFPVLEFKRTRKQI